MPPRKITQLRNVIRGSPKRRSTRIRNSNRNSDRSVTPSNRQSADVTMGSDVNLEESEFLDEPITDVITIARPSMKTNRAGAKKRRTSNNIDDTADEQGDTIAGYEDHLNIQDNFEYMEISLDEDVMEGRQLASYDEKTALAKKRSSSSMEELVERAQRKLARRIHLLFLQAAYFIRNRLLQLEWKRAYILSILPPHLLRQFAPDVLADSRTLLNGLAMLANWWKNNLELIAPSRLSEKSHSYEERVVALFVTALRALGVSARLVVSLQPLFIKKLLISREKSPNNTIPKSWAEVWHSDAKKWVPVDCIRAIVNDRLAMEPPTGLLVRDGRQHLFIIAYNEDEQVFDVTRRYCSRYYGWTLKLRKDNEDMLVGINPVDMEEEELLHSLVDSEPLPATKAGFQGHGRYMLERQLRKYEVFYPPDAGIVGEFRGENVRLRSAVRPVKSKEAWYTQYGRIIKDEEAPIKVVKLPKKPERGMKKKMSEWERDLLEATAASKTAKEYIDQPLWGEWQTIPYQPAVAENGIVPRNRFGNVDLYLPSMLPIGCVWINDDLAWRAAKELGVDYAAACTRFAFSGRFAVPNLKGIVVCAEYEGRILTRLQEIKHEIREVMKAKAEEEKRREERLAKKKARVEQKVLQSHSTSLDSGTKEDTLILSNLETQSHSKPIIEAEDLFS